MSFDLIIPVVGIKLLVVPHRLNADHIIAIGSNPDFSARCIADDNTSARGLMGGVVTGLSIGVHEHKRYQ